ncbi:hypothetical protein E2I00_017552, partial [Balaenoptera physalus]
MSILKRAPRKRPGRVAFDGITVFYFPRCQGFTSARQEKLRLRLKEEKLEALRWKVGRPSAWPSPQVLLGSPSLGGTGVRVDADLLVPYPARKRRALLRASGVRRIDREEKRELQALRQSREDCGCRCDRVCDPETCSCSLAGIKCQMDHTAFPCGCCREGCENPKGRVEFNQARVQTHFIHTLTRLQLEQGAESLGELEAPAQGATFSPNEQVLAPTFPLAKPPVSSELGDNSCSSDMTDSSTASSSSEAPTDIFGTGDPAGLASWTHSYSSSSLASGILDENANLDASCFLNSGLESLGEGSLPSPPVPAITDASQSSSVDLSLSSCDSFKLLQALPDYSLGPHYTSQ